MYGADILAPFTDMPLVFLVWSEDLDLVIAQIEESFGYEVILEIMPSEDVHDFYVAEFGSDAGLTPEEFPLGIRTGPLDIDVLIGVFNLSGILDLIPG